MFILPSQSFIHREFPLKDVFKAIKADKELKDKSSNINKLFVEYVFNSKTTNLEAKSVKEIYFYRIELSSFIIPTDFIVALDKKTKFQTIFILVCEEMELNMTAPKLVESGDVGKTKYVSSEWRKLENDVVIPQADNLDELYCFIYGCFNKYKPFKGEKIGEYIIRNNELKKLDYQIQKTSDAIQFEKQNKKRLSYNHNLKIYQII